MTSDVSGPDDAGPPAAPLISLRRSFQLRISGILLLGIGMWVVLGTFGLLGPVTQAVPRSGWAYVAFVLVMLPTTLSYLELRGWIGASGGSYRLVRAMERSNLTFFTGWVYIAGWAGISALLAQAFATYASRLILVGFRLNSGPAFETWLYIGFIGLLLALSLVTNIAAVRSPWRTGIWLMALGILVVLALALLVASRTAGPALTVSPVRGGVHPFKGVVLLVAAQWVIELIAEAGDRRQQTVHTALVLLVSGPLLSAALVAVSRPLIPDTLAHLAEAGLPAILFLPSLAELALPGLGEILLLAFGTLLMAVVWQTLSLIMLRRFQVIGLDGWIPSGLLRSRTRFQTPTLLIGVQVLLTPAALLAAEGLARLPFGIRDTTFSLASLAAMAFLLLQIGVNVTAIVLSRHPRAADRPLKLPLYPIIPAVGAAISFLFLLAIPWTILILGGLWVGLGALVFWRYALERMRGTQLGVTVFQDTSRRADLTSSYPVVIPVANPDTTLNLVSFGAAIARYYGGHVSVVQVVEVPSHLPLDAERFQARQKLDILEKVLAGSDRYEVPIEGITRLSRGVTQGILDTIAEESAALAVMGLSIPSGRSANLMLSSILVEVLDNAPCDVFVVRGDWTAPPRRILVPVAGGPHTPRAAEMAVALASQAGGQVTLLHVIEDLNDLDAYDKAREMLTGVREKLSSREGVISQVIQGAAPLTAILEAAEEHDAIFLGASESDILDRQYFGQVPMQVADRTEIPAGFFRSYTGLTSLVARKAWTGLSNILPTLSASEQIEAEEKLRRAASPNVNYFVLITLSALIATLGLLLNSPAVIIGAMLVAPLMSPIVAAAMGIVTGDGQTLSSALASTLQGVLAAIFIAIVSSLISPLTMATQEVLARTAPHLLDLVVALVSGMAGAYAIARKEVGDALPGVAIAAALMPPVCTIGIGIALGNLAVAGGAALLFVTNLVAIIFGSAMVFLLLGIRPPRRADSRRWLRQGLLVSILSLIVLSIPLGIILFRTVEESRIEGLAQDSMQQVVADLPDTELVSLNITIDRYAVDIVGTLYTLGEIPQLDLASLEQDLGSELDRTVHIQLIALQGVSLESSPP